MDELQRVPPGPSQLPALYGAGPDQVPLQTIDVAGPGQKHGYAGLLEYWQMVRRHKVAVLLVTFAGGLVGFLLTLSDPRVYQARTTLEIQGLNEDFLNMKTLSPVSDTSNYQISDIQTQMRILQSRLMIDRVREKIDTQPRPEGLQPADRLGMWRKALKLSPPTEDAIWREAIGTAAGSIRARNSGGTRIIDISCDSTNPQLAADFCNTLTREYIDQNLEARWKTTEYTGEWLTKQLQDLQIKIEKQGAELQSYAQASGLVYSLEKTDVSDIKLADLQKELSLAQADRIAKQSRHEMATSSPRTALPGVLDDPALKGAQQTLDDLQTKLAQLLVTFTPSHAEVRRVQVQIDAIRVSLEAARVSAQTRIRTEFESAARREALLDAAYREQARLVSGQAEESAHYGLLKRDVDATRLLYDTLQQRLKEASIASALRANNVRVVDSAERPDSPYKPDPSQKATTGVLFGLVVGIAFSVLRERADRTLQDPGDASYYLALPELGVLPIGELLDMAKTKNKSKSRALGLQVMSNHDGPEERIEMIAWDQKSSLLAESFRTTLTSILFSRRTGERPHVIVLTSASPKEGKSTVVSNLGISLAEINHKVLVIDGDMRRPRLHDIFGIPNTLGLSDLLMRKTPIDNAALEEACAVTTVPGLYVLPSGGSRRNVSSLLHSARLPELLDLARQKFDSIVIDTPPMVNIADARVIARFGDGLILVVRSGTTTRDAALLAKARFADDGIPVIGTILNFWNPKTPGYSYYRYYYAGYHHYYGNGNGNGKGKGRGNGTGLGADDSENDGSSSRAHSSFWKRKRAFDPPLHEDGIAPEPDL